MAPSVPAQNNTFAPVPARPAQAIQGFGHSEDYRVLAGQVQCFRDTCKLRYADFGAVDPYGGNVILEGGQVSNLRDGCQVRVEGQLIPPADRSGPARFQVQTMQILGQ